MPVEILEGDLLSTLFFFLTLEPPKISAFRYPSPDTPELLVLPPDPSLKARGCPCGEENVKKALRDLRGAEDRDELVYRVPVTGLKKKPVLRPLETVVTQKLLLDPSLEVVVLQGPGLRARVDHKLHIREVPCHVL